MKALFVGANVCFALIFSMQGCNRSNPPPRVAMGPTVGKLAPEIEGEDLDGVSFKLSDYRGKIVVLDFWGDW